MKARLPQGYQNSAPNMNQMVRKAQKMQEDIGKIRGLGMGADDCITKPFSPSVLVAQIKDIGKIQEELAVKEFTKQVGGGAIELVMTGDKQLKSVTIKPEVVDPEDIEMLQDLIISGVNEILKEVDDYGAAEMEKVTGGVSFPGFI